MTVHPLQAALAILVVVTTLVGVAIGRYPWVRMNRASIALVGATVLVLLGVPGLHRALASIDLGTIGLLLGMMIINVNLRIAGFFDRIGRWIADHAGGPRRLLALVVFASGGLSALLLNDTIVLAFTPLVISITEALGRRPVPYLIALVAAANVGSAATITGNPQNILVGATSGLGYLEFTAHLLPPALAGLALVWLVVAVVHRRDLAPDPVRAARYERPRRHPRLLRKCLIACGIVLGMLLAGSAAPLAALTGAAVLLVTRRLKPERVFREVDWSLLVFFAALFVVVHALTFTPLMPLLEGAAGEVLGAGVGALTAVSVLLSNLVSNVPAVMLFVPLMGAAPDPGTAWLTLAMATTFAGNLTLLGSVANLIVAEIARRHGVELSFGEYLRCGVPITLSTLAVGAGWLAWVR